ncbi:hypothetical protein CCR95_22530 [Thiocystis minor]|nr:hypothetical protein [Thiocystis minor]
MGVLVSPPNWPQAELPKALSKDEVASATICRGPALFRQSLNSAQRHGRPRAAVLERSVSGILEL